MLDSELAPYIQLNVSAALDEDIRSGDLTARLLPETLLASATVITRQAGVLCGTRWFDAYFHALDADCAINWQIKEGDVMSAGQTLCELRGRARALLSAERGALNFLQTLSGTATLVRRYADAVAALNVKIMDTRKTLPGLRMAQKYAVGVGGGYNQRIGLFDGVLIKENHIAASGGIRAALEQALSITPPGIPIQIEVENLAQLDQALGAGARLILLDNFSQAEMRAAVARTASRAEPGIVQLEASGNVTLDNVRSVALTGVDRISIGALTKDVQAIDLSMRIVDQDYVNSDMIPTSR